MPLKDYYNKHKPKMPKLSKGATNKASKEETDDTAADDDDEEIPKKAVETGDDQQIPSILADLAKCNYFYKQCS